MKYVVIAMATMALLACVCTSTPTATAPAHISTATPGSGPAPAPTETAPAAVVGEVGETITQGDYSVTVVSMETSSGYGGFAVSKSGDEFLAIEIIVQSGANTGVNISPLDVKVKDADGLQYDAGLLGKEPFLPTQNDLPKGEKVRGWATIEIPIQAKGLILTYEPLLNLDSNVVIRFDFGR
jgi:hypothetical protein